MFNSISYPRAVYEDIQFSHKVDIAMLHRAPIPVLLSVLGLRGEILVAEGGLQGWLL